MIAVGSILFTFESLIVMPLPWIRLGLANVVTLLALRWWGLRDAFIIVSLRVLIGSLLSGRFLQPVFLLAVSGGLTSCVAMHFAMAYGKRLFSFIGISVVGALVKNATQLLIAFLLYVRQMALFRLIPIFLVSSLVTGIIIGWLALVIDARMRIPGSGLRA